MFIADGGRMEGVVSVSEGVWREWLVSEGVWLV